MFFMCPNCQGEGEIDFNFCDLEEEDRNIKELHIQCPHCKHWITLNKPDDIVSVQLEVVQDCFDIGILPKEIYESVTILIRQGYAYISGISKETGTPVLKSTEAGDALAEWWDNPTTN